MKKRFAVVILAAGVAVAAWFIFQNLRSEPENAIRVHGNIELTEVQIAFQIAGQLVELNAAEGDPVNKGMVVARLDQEKLLRQRERDQAALEAARSRLAQLHTAIAFQRETMESQIEQRKAEVRQAEALHRELEAGSRQQEIRQAKAAVEEAESELDRAKKDWDRAQVLIAADDISRSQYDQFRARHESAQARLRQADERLELVKEGPRKETIQSARARVEQAAAALKLAEASRLELKRREQEVAARQADIDRAKAQVEFVESQLRDTIAHSPIDGVVLVRSAEVGEVLAPATAVATVGDIARPWLRGYINETDLGRVKLGARAAVTTDSYPGKVYHGRVSFIASEAEFTPRQIQTTEERVKLVYRIKIDVENAGHELKSNMPADAEIRP